jgi:DNA-binding Xre family transcriptional regulator
MSNFIEKPDIGRDFDLVAKTALSSLAVPTPLPYNGTMTTRPAPTVENDPLLVAVGERVQKLRMARDMKPADFARVAKMSQQYLWRLEDGQQNLNLRTLAKVALALDVPMSALLEGIEPDATQLRKRPYVAKASGGTV